MVAGGGSHARLGPVRSNGIAPPLVKPEATPQPPPRLRPFPPPQRESVRAAESHSKTQPTGLGSLLGRFHAYTRLCSLPAFGGHYSKRHAKATAADINRKGDAWEWIREQVRGWVRNPERRRRELVEKVGIVSSELFRRIENCRPPLYFPQKVAPGLRELQKIVSERSMRANVWRMESSHAECAAFWDAVSRSSDRAQGRWPWELVPARVVDGGPIRTKTGEILSEASDDELVPAVSEEDLDAHSSCPFVGASRSRCAHVYR